MPYPQNQVTVKSNETGDVYRISRGFAERHLDILTILDDEPTPKAAKKAAPQVKSADTPADPIAAPVADDK